MRRETLFGYSSEQLASGYTGNDGHYSFTATQGGNYFVRLVLRDASNVHLGEWYLPWDWDIDTGSLNQGPTDRHFGNLAISTGSGSPKCAVWRGAQVAYQDYQATVGARPPTGGLAIQADAPNAGVPFTLYDSIWWAGGYAPGPSPGDYRVAKHEFGHTVRHKLDGSLTHFLGDVASFNYLQNHSACNRTNPGFAFNEGWAEYWANDYGPAPSCPGASSTDFNIEGNVASSLANLQAACTGVTRQTMVNVLRSNPGVIHSFDQFRSHLTCTPHMVGPTPPLAQSEPPGSRNARLRVRNGILSFYRRKTIAEKKQLGAAINASHNPPRCTQKPCFRSLLALVKPDLLKGQITFDNAISKNLAFLKDNRVLHKLGNPLGQKFVRKLKSVRHAIVGATAKVGAAMLGNLLRDGKPIFKKDKSAGMTALKRLWLHDLGPLRKGRIPSGFVLPFAQLDRRKKAPPGDLRRVPALTLTCPANSDYYKAVAVSGRLTPARAGTPVDVTYSQPDVAATTHTVTTDDFGNYTDSFTPTAGTPITTQATFKGDPERQPTKSPSCTPNYPVIG